MIHPRFCRQLAGALFSLLLATQPSCAARAETASSSARALPDYLPVSLSQGSMGQPLLRGRINGKNALLYVDTGAPVSCVDASQARRFHLSSLMLDDNTPVTVNANGAGHRVTLVSELQAGALRIENTPAVLIDFRDINRANRFSREKANDAILGLEILTGLGAILDFDSSRILVKSNSKKSTAFGSRLKETGWTEIPMHLNDGHLAIHAAVNKVTTEWIVDTGSPASVLDRAFCKAHQLPLTRRVFASRAINFQDSGGQIGKVSLLKIGAYKISDLPVAVFDLSGLLGLARDNHDPVPNGLLGCETLVRNRAYIDCGNMKLYLKPAR